VSSPPSGSWHDVRMKARVTSRLAILCSVLLAGHCLAGAFPQNAHDIRVLETGADDDRTVCSDFHVTSEFAKAFFAVAVRISAVDLHDHYDSSPCYVRGTVLVGHEIWYWEMRATGTGSVRRPGKELLLVADSSRQTQFP
jgi:hypothetical protein